MGETVEREKSIRTDRIRLGVCYYPEHWPRNLWADDLDRMKDHGIEIIRAAEFAWNKFEPSEGVFEFDFFDGFLDLAHEKGMNVIFCTPTATPPAWLTEKHPEVLNARIDGTLLRHGMRRHYNYNSPAYRKFTGRIVEKIAEHYCPHPAVVGWQIDNELNCETDVFYSESDHAAFKEYLRKKFGTLEALNDAMGTVFWNQTYTSWDELHLARPTIHMSSNPHLSLEEKRFFSESAIAFCRFQSDIIKRYRTGNQFITTNGLFGHLDSHKMTDLALDFICYDSYPDFAFGTGTNPGGSDSLNDRKWSLFLSRARSISPNFGVMEQQTGPGGWTNRMMQPAPKPGQMRLWTFQSIAHGADFISYFRWRTSPAGTEIYWHGLNDYSNLPTRRLTELKRIRDDVQKIPRIAGSRYFAEIAYVKDYDNEWDGEQDEWYGPLAGFSENSWFTAAQYAHTPMDILYLRKESDKDSSGKIPAAATTIDDLRKYRLLIYPHPAILTENTAGLLREYVEGGGKLLMGARTGYKDDFGRCPMSPMPGHAAGICGVHVSDFTLLGPGDEPESAEWEGERLDAPVFNDILEPSEGTRVLATFSGNYYDGAPALTENELGSGIAWYFGAGFSRRTAEVFLRKLGFADPYHDLLDLPSGVELSVRKNTGKEYFFLLNYKSHPMECTVKKSALELLSGKIISGTIDLEPYGVAILEIATGIG